MAVALIQIGQCGNQIGYNVFHNLIGEMKNSSECISQMICDNYFSITENNKLYANAMLIDMEAKVIERCMKNSIAKGWNYFKENIIHKQSGSGNNWANGFFNHGPSVENNFIEALSTFSEKFDYLDSLILLNSLAGGTGSGLGSYISILIKDYFPTINLQNISIWPHDTGEVVVNSYNTLFSISESYKVSDLMTIIPNQDIYDICRDIYKIKKIGFENLNHVISKQLISIMVPTLGNWKSVKMNPFTTRSFIGEIVENLGVNPKMKFNRIISTPEIPDEHMSFTNNSWSSIIKRGYQMLINKSNESKIDWGNSITVKSKSVCSIFRGKNLEDINETTNAQVTSSSSAAASTAYVNDIASSSVFSSFGKKYGVEYKEMKDSHQINRHEKHLTILNNSNFFSEDLKKTLSKSYDMFEFNAFVHQYEKYGMEKSDFIEAFAFCEQIDYDYSLS